MKKLGFQIRYGCFSHDVSCVFSNLSEVYYDVDNLIKHSCEMHSLSYPALLINFGYILCKCLSSLDDSGSSVEILPSGSVTLSVYVRNPTPLEVYEYEN